MSGKTTDIARMTATELNARVRKLMEERRAGTLGGVPSPIERGMHSTMAELVGETRWAEFREKEKGAAAQLRYRLDLLYADAVLRITLGGAEEPR